MRQAAEQGRRHRAARDARVTLTHANHSSSSDGRLHRRVVRARASRPRARPTIYFAGDTNVFGDMALIRRIYAPDVAVLPIGDHFTMGPREAAVAAELVGGNARRRRATTGRSRC